MTKKKLLEDIKEHPSRFYRAPADVPRDRRFADGERLEILRAWAAAAGDETVARQIADLIAMVETHVSGHAAE